jgi:hypothetical protein
VAEGPHRQAQGQNLKFRTCELCDAAYIYRRCTHERGKPMKRFLEWLDRVALAHPYAALQLFQL